MGTTKQFHSTLKRFVRAGFHDGIPLLLDFAKLNLHCLYSTMVLSIITGVKNHHIGMTCTA
jgi:hypothetical protein